MAEDGGIQDNSGERPESYLQTQDTGDGRRTQALLTTFSRPIGGMFEPNRRMLRGAKQGGPHRQHQDTGNDATHLRTHRRVELGR